MSNQSDNITPAVTNGASDRSSHAQALYAHWVWAIPAGMVMAIIAAFVVHFMEVPEFEATHILQRSGDLGDAPNNFVTNGRAIIMSPLVVDELFADPELKLVPSFADPIKRKIELRKRVKLSNGGTSNLLLITYRDTDKAEVAKVANAIAALYVQDENHNVKQRFVSFEKNLIRPLETARRNLRQARALYEEILEKVSHNNPSEFTNSASVAEDASDKIQLVKSGVETSELYFARERVDDETEYLAQLESRVLALKAEQDRGVSITTRSLAKEPNGPIEQPLVRKMLAVGGAAFLLPFLFALLINRRTVRPQMLPRA